MTDNCDDFAGFPVHLNAAMPADRIYIAPPGPGSTVHPQAPRNPAPEWRIQLAFDTGKAKTYKDFRAGWRAAEAFRDSGGEPAA